MSRFLKTINLCSFYPKSKNPHSMHAHYTQLINTMVIWRWDCVVSKLRQPQHWIHLLLPVLHYTLSIDKKCLSLPCAYQTLISLSSSSTFCGRCCCLALLTVTAAVFWNSRKYDITAYTWLAYLLPFFPSSMHSTNKIVIRWAVNNGGQALIHYKLIIN